MNRSYSFFLFLAPLILPAWILVVVSVSVASGQSVVYPLQTGDQWVFAPSFPFVSAPEMVTGDTLMSNGVRYAAIRYPARIDFQRHAGNQVFQFDSDRQAEYLWYDFSLSPGDTVNTVVRANDTLDITLYFYRITVLFGVNRRQWIFYFNFRGVIDEEQMIEITDSLGITAISMNHGSVYLRGAVINGVTYGDPSGVDESPHEMPGSFRLEQNYPNPFNPVTSIKFKVSSSKLVRLAVYDILGREVATLVNGEKQSGEHSVQFDARELPSGVYYYQLSGGGFVTTKKMILIR